MPSSPNFAPSASITRPCFSTNQLPAIRGAGRRSDSGGRADLRRTDPTRAQLPRPRRRQIRSLFDRANDAAALNDSEAEQHIGRITRLERRLDRERRARQEAETLLEARALELYNSNCHLTALARDLETRVLDRTRELDFRAKPSHRAREPR